MKKNKLILLLMLVLFPTLVFASDGESSFMPIGFAIGMEAFVSIHMSAFVLKPIADVFDPDKSKHLFIILFVIRAVILLFFDFFVTTGIAMVDFFAVFVGAFLVTPIVLAKKGKGMIKNSTINNIASTPNIASANPQQNANVILKCTKCGNVLNVNDKFCTACGTPFDGNNVQVVQDTSPVVPTDQSYLANEKVILKNLLLEELKLQGENENNFTTTSLNTKKNILLGIFGIITFIVAIMYYFNYSLFLCGFIELIALLIYYLIGKKFNVINVLIKQAVKSPDEDISAIVNNARSQKHTSAINGSLKFIIVLLIGIVLPTMFFFNPKILYTKYDDGYSVFRYTRGITKRETSVTIPDTYKGKKVLAIGESAFANTDIQEVHLPVGLETIKTKAFRNCSNLVSIDIPYTVQEIRGNAFENDTNLRSVTLHEGLKEIRGSAFKNDINLSEIELPNSLEYLGGSAFSHCSSLISITIPKKVTEINGQTFEYCTSLRQINLHDDIISIHGETFIGDVSLNNVILPSKITAVRGSTFEGCTSLTSITIPEGVTRIGGHAFYGCTNLSYVSIPSTITEIGSSAFRQCYSLQSVRVPYGAVINERAFKESPTYIERY